MKLRVRARGRHRAALPVSRPLDFPADDYWLATNSLNSAVTTRFTFGGNALPAGYHLYGCRFTHGTCTCL